MPKIFINEQDNTSPGRPNSYANYAVLLAGFAGTAASGGDAKVLTADANGVYEFNSAQEFKDTIGLKSPEITQSVVDESGEGKPTTFMHYGNQMAYELLKLGYKVFYKPITSVGELAKESFWEVFKDRANYDFRFITHGLLSTVDEVGATAHATAINWAGDVAAARSLVETANNNFEKAQAVAAAVEEQLSEKLFYNELVDTISGALIEDATKYTNAVKFFGLPSTTYTTYAALVSDLTTTVFEADKVAASYETYDKAVDILDALQTLINAEVDHYESIPTAAIFNGANEQIINVAAYPDSENNASVDNLPIDTLPGRGDCLALIELDERTYKNSTKNPEVAIIKGINRMKSMTAGVKGKYCALTVPSVTYDMTADSLFNVGSTNPTPNTTFPGAFHYLTCFANSLGLGYAEWYAAAGYTRGVSAYTVASTTVKLGELAINALEPRNLVEESRQPCFACNVIANFRGSYYLWGNRTAHALGKKGNVDNGDLVASSYLNIRHLCTTIKKQLYTACRSFTFDPNSDTLWVNFTNAIRPTLERMKADQGIRDYRIIKEATDKKATLKAKIRIIPIEAVEDFDLEVALDDSFGETVATVAG